MFVGIRKRSAVAFETSLGFLVFAMLSATCASAATLTYGFSTEFSIGSGSVPQFNPTLGTLESVTLTANANYVVSPFRVENQNPSQGGNVTITLSYSWGVIAPDGLNVGGSDSSTGTGYVSAFDGIADGYGPDSYSVGGSGSGSAANTIDSAFSDYEGLGIVTIYVGGGGGGGMIGDPGLWLTPIFSGESPGTLHGPVVGDVTYTYSPVPEPSTLAMLLSIAAGGLLWWRQRSA
jgi:hypothetical protein